MNLNESRKREGEQSAREARSGRLPDDHPIEVAEVIRLGKSDGTIRRSV